ncbi:MAG: glycosyltransferase [Chloroflexota bacterium]|nr:glycosyltransferase [Chloroflexota bacterium]
MFKQNDAPAQPLDAYREYADASLLEEISRLSESLKRVRFVHFTSSAAPEGVVEVVRSLVSATKGAGLQAEWHVLEPPQGQFFTTVSRRIWDLAQGAPGAVRPEEDKIYRDVLSNAVPYAPHPQGSGEVWFLHDFPLLPLIQGMNGQAPPLRFWVCHADLSAPNAQLVHHLAPLLAGYTGLVFSNEASRQAAFKGLRRHVIPPAIDPLASRNRPMPRQEARELLSKLGLDPARPIIAQVGRFDAWKDPRGVVDAYRVASMTLPIVQLVLMGVVADRDEAAARALEEVRRYTAWDKNVHLIGDAASLSGPVDQVVAAVQSGADIVAHLSQREGFGLPVAEAMWKGHPVIGTTVASGVASQIEHDVDGYLVNNIPQCAWYALRLLRDPVLHTRMGQAAREKVRSRFLLPRMLRDYLLLVHSSQPRG